MDGHYFSEKPNVASNVRRVPLQLADLSFELDVDRGVFSTERIDPGTKILLTEAARFDEPAETTPTVLDLGCGYGPIACAVATRSPQATVWATDVNERAIGLCVANATRLGLDRVRAVKADEVPDDVRFDRIVSNPPIRIGKANLHELLTTWLDRLAPAGHAELVVHKHLGSDSLARWLNEQGWTTTRVISRNGYRILRVEARS